MGDFTPKTNWQDGDIPTADDMNRLEQAIYDGGGYSSLKTWADGNVPGVDNWNRMEQGILAISDDVVDGRNFALKSGNYTEDTDLSCLSCASNGVTITAEDGFMRVTAKNSSPGNYRVTAAVSERAKAGQTYTLSCKVRLSDIGNGAIVLYVRIVNKDGNASSLNLGDKTVSVTDEWVIITGTVNIDDGYTITEAGPSTNSMASGPEGATMDIAWIMFEVGDTATDWELAPEDMFETKEWTNEQSADNVINASAWNRWEQGISDMLEYKEAHGL